MRIACVVLVSLALASCHKEERVGTVEGPPLKIAPADAAPAPSASATASAATSSPASPADPAPPSRAPTNNPVSATFADITAKGVEYSFVACEQLEIAIVKGKASALGHSLVVGDVLVARGAGPFIVKGDGLAVVAGVQPTHCEPGAVTKLVQKIPASAAPELTWAAGQMHAHLDVGADVSPNAYMGRLEGIAPVAEHVHPDSWEILCAVEAAGTFTLAGKDQRLGPRQIVVVPPNTKHAWKPDDGKKLVAIQLYGPPGPEQRFKKLAEQDAAVRKQAGAQDAELRKQIDAMRDLDKPSINNAGSADGGKR